LLRFDTFSDIIFLKIKLLNRGLDGFQEKSTTTQTSPLPLSIPGEGAWNFRLT
jgi:hypothetical protein